MDESTFIQNEYDEINNAIKNIKKNEKSGALAKIMEARQKIEIYKTSTTLELTHEYRESNHSIVIFVNFNKTLEILKKKLKTDCVIHGNQTEKTRLNNLKNFMDNKEKIIICNIKAGGTGINLDDKKGWINKNNLWGVYMLEIYKVRFYQPLLNFYWKLRLKFNY